MDIPVTYEFYKNTYYGDIIEESDFPKWLSKATDKLQFLTYDNITEEALRMYSDKIGKAACALIDLLYEIEKETIVANTKDKNNIKSVSSGGESITYAEKQTLVSKVLSNKTAQNKLLQDTISEYLAGTGLLYAGD